MGDVVSGLGSAIGGIAGGLAGDSHRGEAASATASALQNYKDLTAPQFNNSAFQQYSSAGNLTPTLENTVTDPNSELKAIATDPSYTQAQKQALASLQGIAQNNGLTSMDKAQLNQISNQQGAQNAQANAAILQNAAQRGMSNSGTSIAAQLAAQQNSATNAANQGFNVAAQAQQRALQALQGAGQLGTQLQTNQFGQQAQVASAQDAINKFNAANSQAVQGQNVQRQNYADERNLNNTQSIDNNNTGVANQQQQYGNYLAQQGYQDQLSRDQGYTNAANGFASAENNTADQLGQMGSDIGGGIGKAAGGAMGLPSTKTSTNLGTA